MKKYLLLLLMPLLFLIAPVHAETAIPDRPTNGIYDPNHYLSSETSDKLAEFNSSHDTQVGVYIIDTLDGKDIESQANEVSRAWKIGHAETNKGVLIAIAINDRKLRLETSNEASVYLTDSKAKEIISSVKSQLRSKDYDSAVMSMLDSIGTEMTKDPNEQTETNESFDESLAFVLIAVVGVGMMCLVVFVFSANRERIMYGNSATPYSGSYSSRSDYYDKDNDYITSVALGLTAAEIARQSSKRRKSSSSSSYSSSSDDYSGSSYDSGSSLSSDSSYDSGSSRSSGSWGGGGFDGGGSSGDW